MSRKERNHRPTITLPRSFWYSSGIAIALLIILAVALTLSLVFGLIPQKAALAVSLPCTFVSVFLAWVGFKPDRRRRHGRRASTPSAQRRLHFQVPFILNIALAAQFVGNIIHIYNNIHNIQAFPTMADAFIWTACPLMLLALLYLPTQGSMRNMRMNVLLNSALIIVALATFSWRYLLGPMILQANGQTLLALVAHLAFPAADLLLISYVILFATYAPYGSQRLMVSILIVALLIFTFSDSVYQYQLLHAIVLPGWCVLGWCAGSLMMAMVAQAMRLLPIPPEVLNNDDLSEQARRSAAPLWQILLPYVLIPAVFVLAFYLWNTDKTSPLAIGTYCLSILLLTLLFVKQIVAIREIHWLNRGLHRAQRHLNEKNEALEQANTRLEALATTDPLTGLPNHRALQATLIQKLDHAQHQQRDCTLLFFDLDHFKALNDGYGHATGDEVLFAFSQLLRGQVRDIDTVGRWGGEEFLAIFPETTMQEARIFAERLRDSVNQHTFAVAGGLHLTCSIGVASYPTHASTLNDLVNAADQAMYAAKRMGRNQWRSIDDPEVQMLLSTGNVSDSREETTLQGVLEALVALIKRRDSALGEHSYEVANLVERIALKLDSSPREVHMMRLAAHLHDIGKIGVPDAILQKPGPLNDDEWQHIRLHAEAGAQIIAHIPALRPLAPVIRAHHERWDGTGYPDHLQTQTIPLAARVIAVADAYLAMTVERPYQHARHEEDALYELQHCAGTQFDPFIVNALAEVLSESARDTRRVAASAA